MALTKSGTLRWGLLFLCLILGTGLGLFLQRFAMTGPWFFNVVDFVVDIRQIDLVMLNFGFHFGMKLNLGTLLGGLIGIILVR